MSDDPGASHQSEPPERAAPSVWAYRGSIAALVLGSFLALFLVLRPPESESRAEPVRAVATATPTAEPAATPEPATPTPRPTPVRATAVPTTPEPTPVATREPTPEPEPTPAPEAATDQYEVVAGDTLLGIALDLDVTLDSILELNPGLHPDELQIGQIILVPRP